MSHEPHVTCGQWAAASGSAAGYLRRIRIVVRMRCFLEERRQTYEETNCGTEERSCICLLLSLAHSAQEPYN